MDTDAFLAGYSEAVQAQADRLRLLVRRAAPTAVENVRLGWRLIGYDLPVGRRTRFFAYIAPEPIHVHIGFQYGVWMRDPDRRLRGAHLSLRKVRYLTYLPYDRLPERAISEFIREAAHVSLMSREERASLLFDRQWAPDGASSASEPSDRATS